MKILRTLVVVCTLGTALGACGDASALVGPESPRFDAGTSDGRGCGTPEPPAEG